MVRNVYSAICTLPGGPRRAPIPKDHHDRPTLSGLRRAAGRRRASRADLRAGPSARHPLAVGIVLLFESLGTADAPDDALRQRSQDDTARLNALAEQRRAASTNEG